MLALPEARLAVGVKVAVRVNPVPLMLPSVPPVVVMSPSTNPVGASLKVKVIVAVSPTFSAATLLVIDSVGASVSGAELPPAREPNPTPSSTIPRTPSSRTVSEASRSGVAAALAAAPPVTPVAACASSSASAPAYAKT